jgi:alanyl-tRNA synthetase
MSLVDDNGKEVANVAVYDTQVYAGYVLHTGTVTSGSVSTGSKVTCQVHAPLIPAAGQRQSAAVAPFLCREGEQVHIMTRRWRQVDYERRRRIAPNHSFTHVLNFALRKVLGG